MSQQTDIAFYHLVLRAKAPNPVKILRHPLAFCFREHTCPNGRPRPSCRGSLLSPMLTRPAAQNQRIPKVHPGWRPLLLGHCTYNTCAFFTSELPTQHDFCGVRRTTKTAIEETWWWALRSFDSGGRRARSRPSPGRPAGFVIWSGEEGGEREREIFKKIERTKQYL